MRRSLEPVAAISRRRRKLDAWHPICRDGTVWRGVLPDPCGARVFRDGLFVLEASRIVPGRACYSRSDTALVRVRGFDDTTADSRTVSATPSRMPPGTPSAPRAAAVLVLDLVVATGGACPDVAVDGAAEAMAGLRGEAPSLAHCE